jgi:hypothetical protein
MCEDFVRIVLAGLSEQGKILKRPTDPERGNAMARHLQQTLACEVNGAGAGLIEADVAKGAREPVELPHYKDIRLSKLVKKSMQFGPIPTAAGSFLAKDPLASCGFEGANLCGGILFVCGDSCVTDKHVAQRYCE